LAVCAMAQAVLASEETEGAPLKFERFFMVMFENHGYSQCMGNSYWKAFADAGLLLTKFTAQAHPSQPNYICQIAGDTMGCKDDSNIDIAGANLVDLLEANGITWKSYQEDYNPLAQGNCNPTSRDGKYYRKHNPFMSFNNIRQNITRCRNIVNSAQLDADVAANKLPQFGYYTPNIDNDAHDTNLDFAGKYLRAWLDKYMSQPNFIRNTLVLITFDEDEYLEGNHIYAVLLGPYVTAKTTEGTAYTHYSILKTAERNWNLGNLGRKDVTATDFIAAIKDSHARTDADEAEIAATIREEMAHPLRRAESQ